MSYGLSTRSVGAPMGTTGQYARQPTARVVPLSVFFLNMQGQGEDGEDEGLYGKKKRGAGTKKKAAKATRDKSGGTERTVGGGAAQAAQAGGETGQSSASEAMTTAGAALTPIKTGATRASSGSMGVGNIARYHVPIGAPLRRTGPLRGKKKKKTKKDRSRWVQRMLTT